MQIINMKLSEIHPYEKNPRFNDGAVEAVANSIKEFGFQQPIVVDKDFVVIVGHTRLKAAEQLGLTEVPVVIAENLTPEQVQAYRIADNKTGEIAEWNYDLLPIELRDLQEKDFDLSFLGFDTDELDRLAAAAVPRPDPAAMEEKLSPSTRPDRTEHRSGSGIEKFRERTRAWWNAGASHMNEAFPKCCSDNPGLVSLPDVKSKKFNRIGTAGYGTARPVE